MNDLLDLLCSNCKSEEPAWCIAEKLQQLQNILYKESADPESFVRILAQWQDLRKILFLNYWNKQDDGYLIDRLQLQILEFVLFSFIEYRLTYSNGLCDGYEKTIVDDIFTVLETRIYNADFTCLTSDARQFWFGGCYVPNSAVNASCSDQWNALSNNDFVTRSLLSITLIGAAVLAVASCSNDCDKLRVVSVMGEGLEKIGICGIGDLIGLFTEQEDQLFKFCLCSLTFSMFCRLCSTIHVPVYLNPFCVWLAVMKIVNWEASVLMDWLASDETRFLLYLTKFLKFCTSSTSEHLKPCLDDVNLTLATVGAHYQSSKLCSVKTAVGSALLSLKIYENLHGFESSKQVDIFKATDYATSSSSVTDDPLKLSGDLVNKKTLDFLLQLQKLLERSNRLNLLGFNAKPLLKLIACACKDGSSNLICNFAMHV